MAAKKKKSEKPQVMAQTLFDAGFDRRVEETYEKMTGLLHQSFDEVLYEAWKHNVEIVSAHTVSFLALFFTLCKLQKEVKQFNITLKCTFDGHFSFYSRTGKNVLFENISNDALLAAFSDNGGINPIYLYNILQIADMTLRRDFQQTSQALQSMLCKLGPLAQAQEAKERAQRGRWPGAKEKATENNSTGCEARNI